MGFVACQEDELVMQYREIPITRADSTSITRGSYGR